MRLFVIVLALILMSCKHPDISTVPSDNPEIHFGIIGHVDGCTVYRFHDYGEPVYFVRCNGPASTAWNEKHFNGKYTMLVPKQVDTE